MTEGGKILLRLVMADWEATFRNWARGPGVTENEKCVNAERAIRAAINESPYFKKRNIEIIQQGSYRNRVNVKQDSDVDLGVICRDTFFYECEPGVNLKEHIERATYTFEEFKNQLEEALVKKFGRLEVTRGNKAFDIKSNTYRVEADAAPFFPYELYYSNERPPVVGVKMIDDNDLPIINWPEQHYDNGLRKNANCGKRYKKMVRILKRLRNKMEEENIAASKNIPGFLCECLVWNVPDQNFQDGSYVQNFCSMMLFMINNLPCLPVEQWFEVNDIKYLFHIKQKWTKKQALDFIIAASVYFEKD